MHLATGGVQKKAVREGLPTQLLHTVPARHPLAKASSAPAAMSALRGVFLCQLVGGSSWASRRKPLAQWNR